MTVTEFFAALRRRWLIVLLGFLVTTGLTGAAYELSKPTYEITGSVLLLPPRVSTGSQVDNPYLQLGGLRQAVDLLGVALSDQTTQLQLQAMSKDVEFTVQVNPAIASPLLVIDVKDSSPGSATRIRDVLMARVPVQLQEMQTALGVSAPNQVTSVVVTRDTEALEVGRGRLRAGVVVAAAGLVVTFATVALWDAHRLRHPKRRGRGGRGDRNPMTVDEPSVGDVAEETPEAGGVPAPTRRAPHDAGSTSLARVSPSTSRDPLGAHVDAHGNIR